MSSSIAEVLRKLDDIKIGLVDNILSQAVGREAHTDIKLGKDIKKQSQLKNSIIGLSILYYFSFTQSHIDESQWKDIKFRKNSRQGSSFKSVKWDWFDMFKYVRDCFGHDWEGSLFPATQSNTKEFSSIMSSGIMLPSITVDSSRVIILGTQAPFECFEVVRSVLEEASIVA